MTGLASLTPSYTVARFWRCALQVNPSHYQSRYRGTAHGLDEASYNQQLLEQCIAGSEHWRKHTTRGWQA
jgi:hypothetical protein